MQPNSKNSADITSRKGDHIRLCLDGDSQADGSVFTSYKLPYTALPECALDDVDTSFDLLGCRLKMPFVIASMTGGSEHGRRINTNLAIAVQECGVAMGLGSQRIGLEKSDAQDTFKLVRQHAPDAFIIANMGAVQLNYGHTISSYQQVVDMVQANALYVHLNPLQEAIQPGGDTDFSGLLEKIHALVKAVSVPVFVKEVGHGVSGEVAKQLFAAGVTAVDVAGVGGTSYAWVEARRAQNPDFEQWFKDFGIPTDSAVQQCSAVKKPGQLVIASGGVRSPIDGLKARAMGADMFSAAAPFLQAAMADDPGSVVDLILNWQAGLRAAMFASGANNWQQAAATSFLRV